MSLFLSVIRAFALPLVVTTAALADPTPEITPVGAKLAQALDTMDVEHLWIAHYRVNWRTGEVLDPSSEPTHSTHCSAFVAAACVRLNVPMLHPPEHGLKLLANAQYDWLSGPGAANGWQALAGAADAQAHANSGSLVVAVCKNPREDQPGHIVIVRPAVKSADQLAADGPDIIQVGTRNRQRTTARQGFAHHPGAFDNGQILYYAHTLPP